MPLPGGFTPIQHLSTAGGIVNIIGFVVDFLAPGPTRGTDWQCTFSLADERSSFEGQRVKLFKKRHEIPPIRGTGDVVILRHIQLKSWQGSSVLLSNFGTQWVVFHCEHIPKERPDDGKVDIPFVASSKDVPPPSTADMMTAIDLCNTRARDEWTSRAPEMDASGVAPTPMLQEAVRDKFSLIKDVGANRFFDVVGQVIKIFPTGDRLDLYISDYTENSLLFNYNGDDASEFDESRLGDEFAYTANIKQKKAWTGPSGKYTLTVTLFWPHTTFAASKVRENDYVLLRNVHIKLGKDGSFRLEGALHTDKKFPERVDILKVNAETDDRVKSLLRRKRHFQKHGHAPDEPSPTAGTKRPREKMSEDLSKTQLKRQRRKQREAEQKGKVLPSGAKANKVSPLAAKQRALLEPNQNIKSVHGDKPARSVSDINRLDTTHTYTTQAGRRILLPFQNLLSRTKVRVVDFYPSNLAKFAVRTEEFDCLDGDDDDDDDDDDDEDDDDDDEDDASSTSSSRSVFPPSSPSALSSASPPPGSDDELQSRKRWAWFFTLIVEDASDGAPKTEHDRLAIHVADADAEFLLNLSACNLRRSDTALAQLREKLFILWGDLEERRAAAATAHEGPEKREVLGEKDGNVLARAQGAAAVEEKAVVRRAETAPPCRPFECCVKEYGIKRKGAWQRRFRMFGTSIQ